MKQKNIRIFITIGAIGLIALKTIFPNVKIDNTVLILAVIAIIPWLQGVFKSIEFPSGHKIELQDLKDATDKVETKENKISNSTNNNLIDSKPSFLTMIERDANLAIVGLRIEIEKRLKVLASTYEIPITMNLNAIAKELRNKGVFDDNTERGLLELVKFGNQAAHGIEVDKNATDLIFTKGKDIIYNLDLLNAKSFKPNTEETIKLADTVLTFEGTETIEMSISVLGLAIQTGHIMLKPEDTLKMRTGDILTRLGALTPIDEKSTGTWTKHKITPLGNTLYSFLLNK